MRTSQRQIRSKEHVVIRIIKYNSVSVTPCRDTSSIAFGWLFTVIRELKIWAVSLYLNLSVSANNDGDCKKYLAVMKEESAGNMRFFFFDAVSHPWEFSNSLCLELEQRWELKYILVLFPLSKTEKMMPDICHYI